MSVGRRFRVSGGAEAGGAPQAQGALLGSGRGSAGRGEERNLWR
jgi:hypothetical protein